MNTFSSFSLFILSTLKVSIYQCYKKTKINIMMNLRALEKKGIMLEVNTEFYVENLLLQIRQFSKAGERITWLLYHCKALKTKFLSAHQFHIDFILTCNMPLGSTIKETTQYQWWLLEDTYTHVDWRLISQQGCSSSIACLWCDIGQMTLMIIKENYFELALGFQKIRVTPK